jgi:hypothetical protein
MSRTLMLSGSIKRLDAAPQAAQAERRHVLALVFHITLHLWDRVEGDLPHGASGLKPSPVQNSGLKRSHCLSLSPDTDICGHGFEEQMFGAE